MDFTALNYSLTTLIVVAVVSFLLGRWSNTDRPQRGRKPIGEVRTQKPQAKTRSRSLSPEAEREIERLLEKGRLIAAVKVARRDLGIGLKDAKDFIDQVRRKS